LDGINRGIEDCGNEELGDVQKCNVFPAGSMASKPWYSLWGLDALFVNLIESSPRKFTLPHIIISPKSLRMIPGLSP
jgi:hypothetical protein